MRCLLACLFFIVGLPLITVAQSPNPAEAKEIFCGFEDGASLKLQYSAASKSGDMHDGKMWQPGGAPMTLFTQVKLMAGGVEIPEGAYSLYVFPRKGNWILVVSKNVVANSAYDETQDVVRVKMESVAVDTPFKSLDIAFAHTAPKECNLRMYYGKTGAWADFREK